MPFNRIKVQIENKFNEKVDQLKTVYLESPKATVFIQLGKDDIKGRCLMINLVIGSDFWLSPNSVKVTLWQENDEAIYKEQIIELLFNLAKSVGFTNIKIKE